MAKKLSGLNIHYEIFIRMKYSEFLDKRKNTFEKSYELILNRMKENETYTIVELGTSRSFVDWGYKGCLNNNPIYWDPNEPAKWDWGLVFLQNYFQII